LVRPDERVVIVGCGPVGMVLALALYRQGVATTVVEMEAAPVKDQRAATLQVSAIELLDGLGLFAEIRDKGIVAPLYHFRDRPTGALIAEFDHGVLTDDTAFPFAFQYEQYKVVGSIIELLDDTDMVDYRFACRVTDVPQDADGVRVTIENESGETEELRCLYVIGCDGARSVVREAAGIAFEGFTYPERMVKIGTPFDFFAAERGYCTRNFLSDPDEWCNLFHVEGDGPPGIWRCVFPTRVGETDAEVLSDEGVQGRMQRFFPKDGDYPISYTGLYLVHQRVVETFNRGRVLLAGDAGHVNNPIGGLGMNSGIHDAVNLGAKLAAVLRGAAEATVLDRYTRQRRKAQLDYVQAQSIANKKVMEARDPVVRRRQHDELRRTAEDRELARAYMLKSSLLESLAAANAVE
jgi:3-(3-hydroxy-phenyl)propionate hydroxylase